MKNPNIRNFVAVICVFVIFYLISINHRSTVIFANKRLHHGHGNEKSINSLEKSITKLLVLAYPRYDNSIVSMDKYFFIYFFISNIQMIWPLVYYKHLIFLELEAHSSVIYFHPIQIHFICQNHFTI